MTLANWEPNPSFLIAMMTVWDSGAEQIVASVAADDDWQPPAPRSSDAANSGVRIFLFEKIIVRG